MLVLMLMFVLVFVARARPSGTLRITVTRAIARTSAGASSSLCERQASAERQCEYQSQCLLHTFSSSLIESGPWNTLRMISFVVHCNASQLEPIRRLLRPFRVGIPVVQKHEGFLAQFCGLFTITAIACNPHGIVQGFWKPGVVWGFFGPLYCLFGEIVACWA